MAIEHWLKNRLVGDEAVYAVVAGRVYPGGRAYQEAELPYITYRRAGTVRQQHGRGGLADVRATFEIRCWSDSYDDTAGTLPDPVRAAIGDRREAAANEKIQRSKIIDEQDDEEAPFMADDKPIYARLIVLEVVYEEQANTLE